MPITYAIEDDLLLTTLSGTFSVAEVVAYRAALLADPTYRKGMPSLVDVRAVTTLPTTEHLRTLAKDVGTRAELGSARCAVVVESEVAYGLLRMYSVYAQTVGSPIELRPFRDLAEARAWVSQRA